MKLIALLSVLSLCFYGRATAEEMPWMVMDSNNNPCLIAEMNIKTNFSYNTTESTVKNVQYEIPNNATNVNKDKSKCDKSENLLTVEWTNGNSFEVKFTMNNKSYELSSFKLMLNATDIAKDSSDNKTIEIVYVRLENDSSFETPANFSFHCNREQVLNTSSLFESYIILSKVQFEAFKSDKSNKFSLAKDCESNIKPDIVPIAVGISLIALIIVVLIAYIVGRRRQAARGYLNIM